VLKDGLGQLGTLLFGRGLAPHFDRQTKTWYVLAALKLNVAMAMELCTAVFPGQFLAIASSANALKGLTWMAAGSTRAAFNVSFMTNGNIADITAKVTKPMDHCCGRRMAYHFRDAESDLARAHTHTNVAPTTPAPELTCAITVSLPGDFPDHCGESNRDNHRYKPLHRGRTEPRTRSSRLPRPCCYPYGLRQAPR
jgi:hypothetical protein